MIDKSMEKDIDTLIKAQGDFTNLIIAMEECSELIKAISKVCRYLMVDDEYDEEYEELKENVVEEMADVMICQYMLMKIFAIPEKQIDDMIEKKMERNLKRIEQTNEESE